MTNKFMKHAHSLQDSVTLTKEEAKIISKLLSMAADRFSNFGCNDFNAVEEVRLTEEQCEDLHRKIWHWNSPKPHPDDLFSGPMFEDWVLMEFFSKRLENK